MNKQEKQTKAHRHRQQYGGDQREGVGVVKGKGGQIHGDWRRFDFGWWARSATYRLWIMEIYTWNLYNLINQCHPNTFNFFKNPHLVLLIQAIPLIAARIIFTNLTSFLLMTPCELFLPLGESRHQAPYPPYRPHFDLSLTTRVRISWATHGLGPKGLLLNGESVPGPQLHPVPAASSENHGSSFKPHPQCSLLSDNFSNCSPPKKIITFFSLSCGTSHMLHSKHFCSNVI